MSKVFAVFAGNEGYEGYYQGEHECEKFKLLHVFSTDNDAELFVEGRKTKQNEINELRFNFDRKLQNFCASRPFNYSEDAINPPEPEAPSNKKPVFTGDKELFAKEMEAFLEVKKQYSLEMKEYQKKYCNEERMLILRHRQEKQKKQQIQEYRKKLAEELTNGKYTADQIESMQTGDMDYRIEEVELN